MDTNADVVNALEQIFDKSADEGDDDDDDEDEEEEDNSK